MMSFIEKKLRQTGGYSGPLRSSPRILVFSFYSLGRYLSLTRNKQLRCACLKNIPNCLLIIILLVRQNIYLYEVYLIKCSSVIYSYEVHTLLSVCQLLN